MKPKLIAGNWKMHGNLEQAHSLATRIRRGLRHGPGARPEVALFPPFPHLRLVADAVRDSELRLGAQNMHWEPSGAFTGEVSAGMLVDLGCRFVILGHSERRQLFFESDAMIRMKVAAALGAGLTPILCVGETGSEREDGLTRGVLEAQLKGALSGLDPAANAIEVAYEPVWAIGTGRNATPPMIAETHALIRRISDALLDGGAGTLRILYGGSVKPDNAREILAARDVGGVLVGGASLNADDFVAIARSAGEAAV